MKLNNCKYLAKIIVTKVIDKSKTEDENILKLTEYLTNRQFEDIAEILRELRLATVTKEKEILNYQENQV